MILDDILEHKRLEVECSKTSVPEEELRSKIGDLPQPRDFLSAITPDGGIKVIAEVKRASPSKGVFKKDIDPVKLAVEYSKSGASAISVLTDKKYFKGDLAYLMDIKKSVPVPLLRKDFIIDPYQVFESRAYGADGVLLIVGALEKELLGELLELTALLGMNALVEVHSAEEVGRALEVGSRIIGINNRNLNTFDVDLGVSIRLHELVPAGRIVVSESGIDAGNIGTLIELGIGVFLVGEAFVKAPDPGGELRALLGRL
ncbi:MAG: indole-3-glycerol phosphate synthase TrpC [Thermodesulfobacteriota bacterium]